MDIVIKHDKEHNRFFINVENYIVQLDYSLDEDIINFYHTYTPPQIRQRGFAKRIVEHALNYAKENNLKVIASCTFVQSFITANDSYKNLLV